MVSTSVCNNLRKSANFWNVGTLFSSCVDGPQGPFRIVIVGKHMSATGACCRYRGELSTPGASSGFLCPLKVCPLCKLSPLHQNAPLDGGPCKRTRWGACEVPFASRCMFSLCSLYTFVQRNDRCSSQCCSLLL